MNFYKNLSKKFEFCSLEPRIVLDGALYDTYSDSESTTDDENNTTHEDGNVQGNIINNGTGTSLSDTFLSESISDVHEFEISDPDIPQEEPNFEVSKKLYLSDSLYYIHFNDKILPKRYLNSTLLSDALSRVNFQENPSTNNSQIGFLHSIDFFDAHNNESSPNQENVGASSASISNNSMDAFRNYKASLETDGKPKQDISLFGYLINALSDTSNPEGENQAVLLFALIDALNDDTKPLQGSENCQKMLFSCLVL